MGFFFAAPSLSLAFSCTPPFRFSLFFFLSSLSLCELVIHPLCVRQGGGSEGDSTSQSHSLFLCGQQDRRAASHSTEALKQKQIRR